MNGIAMKRYTGYREDGLKEGLMPFTPHILIDQERYREARKHIPANAKK